VLDIFRGGRDIYSENAVKMFKLGSIEEVTKALRQSAKVAVLALGFGGGYNALINMAKAYGMAMTEDEARKLVELWREANPWANRLWYGLQNAAHNAVKNPNTSFKHGRISYLYDGKDWLWGMLPSGRCIAYFQPRFEMVDYPWGDSGVELTALFGSQKPKAGASWPRRSLTVTALSNNATQASAADVMRQTIVRAHDAGLELLFSVHDELIVEGYCAEELETVMVTAPLWADGLPLNADTQKAKRYGK
jgi:DNA polymerase